MDLRADPFSIIIFVTGATLAFTAVFSLWSNQNNSQPIQPQTDWLEAVFVSLVSVVIFTGWLGVTLASIGRFSLSLIAAGLWVTAVFLLWWQRGFTRPSFARLRWQEGLLLILLLGSAIVYFRPHEYVLGGGDAGGYINIGATLARTGQFIVHDDAWTGWLRQFPDVTLRQQPPQWRTKYLQFVGWYIDDADPTRIIPQFFPFHPTLLAVGISLAGLMGGLMVTPLWTVLALLAVYLLTRRLFGRNTALLAAALLAITAVTIYFARFPTTEPLTLLLVFTGLLSWQTLWDNPRTPVLWDLLGGAAFGTAFLTRIDLPLVAFLLYGGLILVWLQGKWRRGWTVFAVTLSFLTAQALVSAVWQNWPYVWNTYGALFSVFRGRPWLIFLAAAAGFAVLAVIFLIWRQGWETFRQGAVGQAIQSSWFRWLLVMAVVSLSAYAYFLRPSLEPPRSYITWPGGTTAWSLDGQNWVRLGWYITPLGILLTTLGLGWILRRESLHRLVLFLSVTVLTIIQYVFKIFNTPYHIYTMRRYLPIALPALMIFAAYFLVSLFFAWPKRAAQATAVLLTVLLAGGLLYQSRFVLPLRENQEAVAQLQNVADELQPDAILVIVEPAASTFADTFGPPLRFIYGHDIATIRTDNAQAEQFLMALYDMAGEEARPLQLLAVDPIPLRIEDQLHLEPVAFTPVTLRRLASTFFDYPSAIETAYYGIEIYDVIPPDTVTEAAGKTTVDIGTFDAPYIQSGFFSKEPLPGPVTMRWTSGLAELEAPTAVNQPVQITLRAKIFRPEMVSPSEVTVLLDGQPIGAFTPTEKWQTFTFTGQPHPVNGESLLQFQAETFNPAELGVNGDSRDLGFLLDWVEITPDS